MTHSAPPAFVRPLRHGGPGSRSAGARFPGAILAGAAMLMLGLGGCASNVRTHGHQIEERRVELIKPGVTSREEVARIMGSPSTLGTFDSNKWYYVMQRTDRANFFQEELVAQDVLIVTFDKRGIVEDIGRRDVDNAVQVAIDQDKTRTLGKEMNVVEQFVGNIGRFNKEGLGPATIGGPRR